MTGGAHGLPGVSGREGGSCGMYALLHGAQNSGVGKFHRLEPAGKRAYAYGFRQSTGGCREIVRSNSFQRDF